MVEKRPIRIFAVEDDVQTWQRLIKSVVKSLEAELVVPIVADFEAAMQLVAKLAELKVDIAILDGNITPDKHDGLEGLALLKKIKELFPEIKVIGFSSYVQGFKNAGADAVVDKVQSEELKPTILKLVQQQT